MVKVTFILFYCIFTVFHNMRAWNWLHCAISLAAQCIVIGPVCCLCLWVCYYDNSKLRASIFILHRTAWVCRYKGSDHLQLIKSLAILRPREGGLLRGEIFFGPALLQPARCLRLSERFLYHCHSSKRFWCWYSRIGLTHLFIVTTNMFYWSAQCAPVPFFDSWCSTANILW